MYSSRKTYFSVFVVAGIILSWLFFAYLTFPRKIVKDLPTNTVVTNTPTGSLAPTQTLESIIKAPNQYSIGVLSHTFQTFNNCGPASLSMALSAYGITATQSEIGNKLRPWQNAAGNNDDKSVTLEEIANEAENYGLVSYLRPNGNFELLKKFIANDMVVITRTLLEEGDDIGHYRVLYGYSDINGTILQNDSMDGKELEFSYDHFDRLWKPYGYEYLVLVPKEKDQIAKDILGEEVDEKIAWENSVERLTNELAKNPSDTFLRFSLSVAYYHTGQYQKSVDEFEKVESRLSFRTLWYQIEPLYAYYELGRYDDARNRIAVILEKGNRAYSEAYLLLGQMYLNEGKIDEARNEFELAHFYNVNLDKASEALNSL